MASGDKRKMTPKIHQKKNQPNLNAKQKHPVDF